MKCHTRTLVLVVAFLVVTAFFADTRAETSGIDLTALAKKARPAVMLLIVSDASSNQIATGTGFLVSSDGKLVTNHHVVQGGASINVKAEDGSHFTTEGVLADDPTNDLILLNVKGKDLPYLRLGSSKKTEVGQRVAVIGSPLGLEGSLSEGIVSALREPLRSGRLLQITAAVSPGSSGSPVLNSNGEVIGVASAQIVGGQALNFAVPVEAVSILMTQARQPEKVLPLARFTASEQDKIFSDPDYKVCEAASFSQDYATMLKHAQLVVNRYPENPEAYINLGFAYMFLNFKEDAISSFRAAVKLKPDYVPAWDGLAFVYKDAEMSPEATDAHQQVVKLQQNAVTRQPNNPTNWYDLGQALEDADHGTAAIEAYRRAIKLDPHDYYSWCALAWACHCAKRDSDAVEAAKKAIEIDPDASLAWCDLAFAYDSLGRKDDAKLALEQANKADARRQVDQWFKKIP